MSPLSPCPARWPRCSRSRSRWCCRPRCSRTSRSQGVVPDLVLLVVVAAGLAYGSELGLVLGFGAGLLLDLAPPADHYAGRWALALMVVGLRRRAARRPRAPAGRPVAAGGRGGVVRRHVGVRAHRAAAARPRRRRRRAAPGRGRGPALGRRAGPGRRTPHAGTVREGRARPGPGVTPSGRTGEHRSRLRLVVIQALVFSLFATLLRPALLPPGRQRRRVRRPGRLAVGARDRRAAAARADRRRHGPAAGRQPHLVGGLGRPRHAGQAVRSDEQRRCCTASPRVTDVAVPRIHRLLTTCGDDKARAGRLLERLAVPAGAGRGRRAPADGAAGARAARGLPGRDRRAAEPARLPRSRTASTPRTCSATSARSPARSTTRRRRTATRRSTAPPWSAGPASRRSTTRGCAGCPATSRSRSTRWAG